ncbi:hypothetical protein KHQ81_06960 [Mycoplasmatota bacterium]|nr:hypothetical protein KHQ81_06960 [Mycoplasmatota bacterium]
MLSNNYYNFIPFIISSPDYIGINPSEPNSIEIIKHYENDVLIAIKWGKNRNLKISSMYSLAVGKVSKRLKSGRIISIK